MDKWWILKFTDEGGVWASETPLSPAPLSPPASGRSVRTSASVLQVGDFVLAAGKRAQIKNIFLSVHRGSLARLFYIDTAEDGTLPLQELTPIPEKLMHPPHALYFKLDGISPQLNMGHDNAPSGQTKCVGRPDTLRKKWGLIAMETLRNVAQVRSGSREVAVRVDMRPGDQIVLYCDTPQGEQPQLNFNQFLLEAGLAIPRPPSKPPPPLLNSTQLLSALESLSHLQTEISPISKLVIQVEPAKKTALQSATEMPIPYQYYTVYVDSPDQTKPCSSLEEAGFPGSICAVLTRHGFQTPSPVQACGWPLVARGNFTILVSPPLSGKTLAYLLPLVTKRELARSVDSSEAVPRPRLIVLVASSWEGRAVYTRARELVSALSASRRFRCCCAYKAVEGEVTVELLNGVEILVCTPTSLLRLVDKTVARLDSLLHLVLDDIEQLQQNFPTEVQQILSLCSDSGGRAPIEVVVTSSSWSPEVPAIHTLISSHTHLSSDPAHLIIACPIEASIRAGVKMDVIPCIQQSPDSMLQQLLNRRGCGHSIVCVATIETANRVSQYLEAFCWPVRVVRAGDVGGGRGRGGGGGRGKGGGGGGEEGIEQLLQKETVVIIADDVLPSVLPLRPQISHLIHYELPKKKASFNNRLALLYSAMHREVTCGHTVLLTDRWQHQASLLKTMIERLGQTPPQTLLDMAERTQQTKEEQRKNFDLCYKLKAWGSCSNPLCPSRHTHATSSSFPSPRPLQLPEDGSVKLKVSHVSTATRWWVSLVGHAPLYRGAEPVRSHDPDGLVKMTSDLAQYFTPERQRELLHCAPAEGNYCALRDRDGCFYRVRILKFSRPLEFMFHHREKAKVRLIDIGEARIVDVSQLLPLPDHLLTPPALVFEVFVCGVKPTDFDPDWPPQAAQAMREVYQERLVHGRVVMVSGETMWLDPVEQRYTLEGLNISTALTSPQQQLMKAGMAEPNPDHLVNLSNYLGLPLVTVQLITIEDASLSFASLLCGGGGDVEVCVSAVDSPNLFYLQLIATESKVIELEDALNRDEDVASMASPGGPLPAGSLCAAQFSYNNCWYRGCVLEVKGHESQVRFLDYGNVEWVPNHLVQPIDHTALKLPFQAIECSFGMDDAKWGVDAGTLLYEWTRELVLLAKVVSTSPSERLCGAVCYTVELYERTSAGGGRTNIALRLPAVRPGTATSHQKSPPLTVNHPLEQLFVSLCTDQTREERESIAMAIKNTVYNKPGVCVSGRVLVSACQLLSNGTPPSVSIPLLRALCCLATFHSGVCVELSGHDSLSYLLKLVEYDVTELFRRGFIKDAGVGVHLIDIYQQTTLELLLGVFRIHGNTTPSNTVATRHGAGILRHLIIALHHILTNRPELVAAATEYGIVPLLCRWLSDTPNPSLLPSGSPVLCSRASLILSVFTVLELVARLDQHRKELCVRLPLEKLHTMISKDSTRQMVHAILRLLIPLSALPEFGSRLHSSSLLSSLRKLPMTATTGLLFHQLNSHLILLEPTLVANGSHTTSLGDSPPPLIDSDDREAPDTFICNEESSNEIPAFKRRVVAVVNSAPGCTAQEKTNGLPCPSQTCALGNKITILHPHVLWSQKEAYVLLAVQLRGCGERETAVNFSPTAVSFQTRVRNQDYLFSIDLYSAIDPAASSLSITGSEVLLSLVKSTPVLWPRLPLGGRKLTHVSVDFDRWEDDDGPSSAHIFSNWPTCFKPNLKNTAYINPLLTGSEDVSDGSMSHSQEDAEEEKKTWEDDLDLEFGDMS